jgi:DNA-binding CsgD family transcriptional regulator
MLTTNLILTARERTVAERLAVGRTNAEIGVELLISIKTVDTHRGHILRKLKLRNNAELVHWAIRNGLVQLQPGATNAEIPL